MISYLSRDRQTQPRKNDHTTANATLSLTSSRTHVATAKTKKLNYTALATLAMALGISNACHGALIFADDFSRQNNTDVGNHWSELENHDNDVAIYQQQLRLRDNRDSPPSAAAFQPIEPQSFSQLSLSFDWRATSSTEPSDTLFVGWRTQNNELNMFWSIALGGSDYTRATIDMTDSYTTNVAAELAFWLEVGSANETVYLDNISLNGEWIESSAPDNVIPVPEPASLALLTASLCLMRLSKRTPKQALAKH